MSQLRNYRNISYYDSVGKQLSYVDSSFVQRSLAAGDHEWFCSASGSGQPSLVDYVVGTLPSDPAGYAFSVGCYPHTISAYMSPVSGRATGLMLDYGPVVCYSGGTPQYIALIDLAWLLAAPRSSSHVVNPSIDLVGSGIVKFVQVQ